MDTNNMSVNNTAFIIKINERLLIRRLSLRTCRVLSCKISRFIIDRRLCFYFHFFYIIYFDGINANDSQNINAILVQISWELLKLISVLKIVDCIAPRIIYVNY